MCARLSIPTGSDVREKYHRPDSVTTAYLCSFPTESGICDAGQRLLIEGFGLKYCFKDNGVPRGGFEPPMPYGASS